MNPSLSEPPNDSDSCAIKRLRSRILGELLFPGNDAYESARRIHNGMIDRRPAVILRCASAADVTEAIRFAREQALPLSVKGGGHGVAGFAVCDGGVMIDLSGMKAIRVDAAQRIAWADAGATWGDFDRETQRHGLATTGGLASPTGIAGLTLAGGHGILMRQFGLACDNLIAAEVMTASGHSITASASQNADLFWGLRGGGGNFGVVTSFHFRLHPVETVLGGLVIFPIEQAREILKRYHEFTLAAPDQVGCLAILGTLPDGTKAVILLLSYHGPIAEGERVLNPLRTAGTPIADQIAPIPYLALQSIVEKFNPPGLRNYWKARYLNALDEAAIDTMAQRFAAASSPHSHIVLYTLGGAVGRVPCEETAVAFRDARHVFLIVGMWSDASADGENIQWVRDLWMRMEAFCSRGFYINYEADVASPVITAAFGHAKHARLVALKAKYDPDNLFRLNQNIEPSGARRLQG